MRGTREARGWGAEAGVDRLEGGRGLLLGAPNMEVLHLSASKSSSLSRERALTRSCASCEALTAEAWEAWENSRPIESNDPTSADDAPLLFPEWMA